MDDKANENAAGTETPAAEAAVAKFAQQRKRFRTVPLDWPIEYGGTVYKEVTVRRMTGQEVADFISAAERGDNPSLPMFDVPKAVIDALDADDSDAINKAVHDFLPRSLRPEIEQSPNSGAPTPASQPSG